jgi:hypothetical protein
MANLGLKHHRLDNEASTDFKECIREKGMTHKLVPPSNYMRNLAERAIQTFKHHFISILSGVDDKSHYPSGVTYLAQQHIVNLLHQSNKISAYAHVHGQHGYMRKPFAPLGCAVQAPVKPDACQTWDTHFKAGFNIGTSMEHHCCFKVYILRTRAMRISNAVFFKHQNISSPVVSPKTMVIQAPQQLTSALQGNVAPGTKAAKALRMVSKLFTKIALAKASATKAKEQQNQLQTHPEARRATPFPRVAEPNARVKVSLPRVTAVLEADNRTTKIFAGPPKPQQVAQAPTTHSQSCLPKENMQVSCGQVVK